MFLFSINKGATRISPIRDPKVGDKRRNLRLEGIDLAHNSTDDVFLMYLINIISLSFKKWYYLP